MGMVVNSFFAARIVNGPADISGLSFWYDPQDTSTIFQDSALTTPGANGQPIGGVTDKSGNGRFLQNAGSGRPTFRTGSLNYFDFDGFDDALVYIGTNVPCGTAFVVAKLRASSNDAGLLTNRTDQANNVDVALSKTGAADTFYVDQGAGKTLSDSSHIWQNRVQTVNYTISSVKIFAVDGTGFAATLQFPTGISVGNDRTTAFRHMNCDIYEIIGYGSVLSASDRAAVEQYLATKHGIAL